MEADRVLDGLVRIAGSLEDVYRDLHQHPELSMVEHRTAAVVSDWLRSRWLSNHERCRRHWRRRRAALG